MDVAQHAYAEQEERIGLEGMRYLERVIFLQMVDTYWKEHLLNMDHLKEGIGLRGYGQKNPLNEYKREGFEMFANMIETVKQQTLTTLFRVQIAKEEDVDREALEKRKRQQAEMRLSRGGQEAGQAQQQPLKREGEKIGRNDPCPCGSGKKYKKCCGKFK
jgi:preprotein translocase subunit SecA